LILTTDTLENDPLDKVLTADAEDMAELFELGCTGQITAHTLCHPMGPSILIEIKVRGTITVDCGRCLDPLTGAFELPIRLLIEKQDQGGLEWLEAEAGGVEEYVAKMGPEVLEIPLEHLIAEQIILNYNLHPLPTLDESNRCLQCGRNPVTETRMDRAPNSDPRWDKLKSMKLPGKPRDDRDAS
jgi:uncharacterized metal-binding protein YceD (DUF177 family)